MILFPVFFSLFLFPVLYFNVSLNVSGLCLILLLQMTRQRRLASRYFCRCRVVCVAGTTRLFGSCSLTLFYGLLCCVLLPLVLFVVLVCVVVVCDRCIVSSLLFLLMFVLLVDILVKMLDSICQLTLLGYLLLDKVHRIASS